jgi:hypothetical protein
MSRNKIISVIFLKQTPEFKLVDDSLPKIVTMEEQSTYLILNIKHYIFGGGL